MLRLSYRSDHNEAFSHATAQGDLHIHTNGHLIPGALDPNSGAVVDGCSAPQTLPLVVIRVPCGGTERFPFGCIRSAPHLPHYLKRAKVATMWPRAEGLRAFSFGDPGPMRRRLTALALAGTKVATAGLWQQDYLDEGETIDVVGERQALLGNDNDVVAIIEITRVETHLLPDVPSEFAEAEGEGFRSIQHWREGHHSYYAKRGIHVDDTTSFVCAWFRLVEIHTEPLA